MLCLQHMAFINMGSRPNAEKAKNELHTAELHGRPLKVLLSIAFYVSRFHNVMELSRYIDWMGTHVRGHC